MAKFAHFFGFIFVVVAFLKSTWKFCTIFKVCFAWGARVKAERARSQEFWNEKFERP